MEEYHISIREGRRRESENFIEKFFIVLKPWQMAFQHSKHNQSPYFQVVAHEMGHNMGMTHDFTYPHKTKGCNGIMDYGESEDKWSECSKSDFIAQYEAKTLGNKPHCMKGLKKNVCMSAKMTLTSPIQIDNLSGGKMQ